MKIHLKWLSISPFFLVLVVGMILVPFFKVYGQKLKSKREGNRVTYHLNIEYKFIRPAGKKVKAMLINQTLPGPTLYFKEGDHAIIYVTNKMDQPSSLHWHGILLPSFQDGVPYLTSPPIPPGQTYKYEFTLKHSGTYWYHSHTGLQEQRGIFGGIVIQPKVKKHQYDKDFLIHLSDWSNESPNSIMRTLKRESEWYSIQKNTTQSLNKVIQKKALSAQLKMWRGRMPSMDISDIYYEAFLLNGKKDQKYPQLKQAKTIRLRWINSSASTYFWLSFGGPAPQLISADGMDVHPVKGNKLLHAIGETYDFLLKIPKGKSIEVKATAQDGSGSATAILGQGPLLKAPVIPKYDPIEDMKNMGHDHHAPKKHQATGMHHAPKKHQATGMHHAPKKHQATGMHHAPKKHQAMVQKLPPKNLKSHKNLLKNSNVKLITYDQLKSLHKTNFSKNQPVKEIKIDLTGDMRSYVWGMDNKVLSESDVIPIKKNQVLRLHLNNTTMMHHPMHLHGHFFRVLNKNGDYSPLKHTVNVPPMKTVTLEFESEELGDWFFHCHILYHMKAGMARVFRHGKHRDKKLAKYPLSKVMNTDRQWYPSATADILSNRVELTMKTKNTRNEMQLEGQWAWLDKHYEPIPFWETELSYTRFFSEFFQMSAGLKLESDWGDIRALKDEVFLKWSYLFPYLVEGGVKIKQKLCTKCPDEQKQKTQMEFSLEYELLLFPRLEFFSEWKITLFKKQLALANKSFQLGTEYEGVAGLQYTLKKNLALIGSYDHEFGWAGGIQLKF